MINIYGIRNLDINEIVYVGQHNNDDLDERMKQHRKDKKYPEKVEYLKTYNCQIELLHSGITGDRKYEWENHYIHKYETIRKKGYDHKLNKNYAKETKTTNNEKMKNAIESAKTIIKKNKKKGINLDFEKVKLDEYDRYIGIDYNEKKFNNLGDLFK
jgi:hypothetical protein